jgi:predicted anti-sigma-YlaC factor YlaD
MIHKLLRNQLPFYAAGVLSTDERASMEQHLQTCRECRHDLAEWQRVALAVRAEAGVREGTLPPLSPVVRGNLQRRPTYAEALRSALMLVWAQRMVVLGGSVVPAAVLVLLLGLLATLGLRNSPFMALPLLGLIPIIAALGVAFLYGPDADPAFAVVGAAPTPASTLLFARLTLVLGILCGVATGGSVLISAADNIQLLPLIGAWLGPLLLLSALATVLALVWRPLVASGVTLAIWTATAMLVGAELTGRPLLNVSLLPLIEPSWALFGGQVVLAVALWAAGWWLLARETVGMQQFEIN